MPSSSQTTSLPPPVFMPQSSSASLPAPSPIPHRSTLDSKDITAIVDSKTQISKSSEFVLPKLRLEVRDLVHPGTSDFLSLVVASDAIKYAVRRVLELLYISPEHPYTTSPGTRSVTLILKPMDGVAYTIGSELDNDHKEINFSVNYIKDVTESRKREEILGVLVHEMVHCYQWNGKGTCPGGLIEGIADWVRLNSSLAPPHWKRETSGKWDAGYQHTAYFLNYLETRFGNGTVVRMNEKLRVEQYQEKRFWTELLGRSVDQLWSDYSKAAIADEVRAVGAQSLASGNEIVMVQKDYANSPGKSGE